MTRSIRGALVILAAVAGLVLLPAVAHAHPLGNFTVNTFAAITLTPEGVRVDYVVDMAEIPTVQVMPELDADGDGAVSSAEGSRWAAERTRELLGGLSLSVDGARIALDGVSERIELMPGQGGLDVLRLESTSTGTVAAAGELVFHDGNFEDRIGWREVVATGVDGTAVFASSVPATSVTDRLRTYPEDLLSSPLDVRDATVSFRPGASAPASSRAYGSVPPSVRAGVAGGALAGLVDRTGPLMLLGLGMALGLGALHALGPGHGKTLMAAYLIGSGGRARHAVAVGGAVALMHTASVLALGVVVLTAAEVFAPERLYPLLALASGLIALGLGAWLLVSRLGAWSEPSPDHGAHERGPVGHAHGAIAHSHPAAGPSPLSRRGLSPLSRRGLSPLSRRGLTALAVAGGILPSPTALVVLLAALALHRVGYGLALIGAFSLGLAAALVAIGLAALRARDVVARRMSGKVARLVPVASAGAIALLGMALTLNGVAQL